MSDLSRQLTAIVGAADDLAIDNARAELRRAEYVQAVINDLTDDELRVMWGVPIFYRKGMQNRLQLHVDMAREALEAAERAQHVRELHAEANARAQMDAQDAGFGSQEWAQQEDAWVASRGGYSGD